MARSIPRPETQEQRFGCLSTSQLALVEESKPSQGLAYSVYSLVTLMLQNSPLHSEHMSGGDVVTFTVTMCNRTNIEKVIVLYRDLVRMEVEDADQTVLLRQKGPRRCAANLVKPFECSLRIHEVKVRKFRFVRRLRRRGSDGCVSSSGGGQTS